MATRSESRAQSRARLDRTFAEELYGLAVAMQSVGDGTLAWVADKVNELADRARFLDARDGADFDDKLETLENQECP